MTELFLALSWIFIFLTIALLLKKMIEDYIIAHSSMGGREISNLVDKFYIGLRMSRKALRGYRKYLGLTQIGFAKEFGLTQCDVSLMENGKKPIPDTIQDKIKDDFLF